MKTQKTFFLIIALSLSLILGLSACGGAQATTQANQNSGSAATGSEAAPAQSETPAGDPEKGKDVFVVCGACHGPEGEGIVGLGKDMTASEFIAGKTDAELVEFIKVGRPTSDPLNTTGVDMPPKGGNPALSDDDLYNVVAYIRTLQK